MASPEKRVRFQRGDLIAYGSVDGDRIRQLEGDLFSKPTGTMLPLDEVRLLVPSEPSKIIALAGNYRSHIKGAEKGLPEKFQIPQPFYKPVSCLLPHKHDIVLPAGSEEVHYEAEMVLVIGKRSRKVSRKEARGCIFGVTCGNDVSARDWQRNDVQWWRAKGSDTFGPVGPYVACGIDYSDLLLELRLNGDVKQSQRTCDLIHDPASIVSTISQQVTLEPGDLVFTGTPKHTTPLSPGDVVEVVLEGVGVLRNGVVAADS